MTITIDSDQLTKLIRDPLIVRIVSVLDVVFTDISDIIAYRHGLHFCREVNPNRNQNKV